MDVWRFHYKSWVMASTSYPEFDLTALPYFLQAINIMDSSLLLWVRLWRIRHNYCKAMLMPYSELWVNYRNKRIHGIWKTRHVYAIICWNNVRQFMINHISCSNFFIVNMILQIFCHWQAPKKSKRYNGYVMSWDSS